MAEESNIQERAEALFEEMRTAILRRTDRLFAWLIGFEWIASVATAIWISPNAWAGSESHIHPHVWAAVFLGGTIASLPIVFALLRPGATLTRHTIAIAQMLTCALLIHLSGGRIETHFSIFGSLAFLSFYRDWPVLVSGTIVIALDHGLRGVLWPQSIYGVVVAQPWRWLEHAGWVVFEDIFLIIAIGQSLRDMHNLTERQAHLESVNAHIQDEVNERTRDLHAARETALAASQAKSEFLSSMSHEIRTPMNAILGMAELLGETPLNNEQQKFLGMMRSNTNSLLSLINSILDLAKIESGRLTLENVEFELDNVVDSTVDTLGIRAHAKGLELISQIDSEVPLGLIGDPLRLRQILINLIGNAIKFTEHGEIAVRVACAPGKGDCGGTRGSGVLAKRFWGKSARLHA